MSRYTCRMAHIYIYSPSTAVRDKAAFKRGVKRLQTLGHEVEIDPDALASHTRFAGDDATRVAAVHRAAASGADIAMISRGGYGLTRILPAINYKAVAKSIERGTQWVGYSDFSALQAALWVKTGAVTWLGPALGGDFGCTDQGGPEVAAAATPDDIMEACFDDLVQGIGEGAGWRMPIEPVAKNTTNSIAARAVTTGAAANLSINNATLWGGNLCVLTALLGTPYLPQIDKGVLLFEDVGEHPYRIERNLTTWLMAGILQRQKAIVLGQFTGYQLVASYEKGYKLQTVVDWLRTQTKVPVLTGLPFGHVPTKVCLPFGKKISLNTEGRDALMFWGD
jgi:muramoyltetrapeptide carboxypeptidase